MAHLLYVIDVQFLFLMTFENVYVVHHGNYNYVLKIPRKLENYFLLTLCIFGYFNLIERRKKV